MTLAVKIAGLGYYLPERVVPSAALAAQFGCAPGVIERATGVVERRYASGETTAEMGAAAARMALAHAGMAVEEIDAIIVASSAPQQAIPCTAVFVQRALGAPEGRSVCYDLNATCLSFVLALHNAAHLVAAGAYRCALVVSSEIASASLNPDAWESAALFGDAAAAALVVPAAPGEAAAILGASHATWHSGAELTQVPGGGTLHHPNDPATTAAMNMFAMQGPAIFRFALREMRPFLDRFLASIGWEPSSITRVVPHQASRHAIDQLTARLGFRPEQIASNLSHRGNCVAASIPLALAEAVHAGTIARGDRVLLLGTGAGLTIGALALIF